MKNCYLILFLLCSLFATSQTSPYLNSIAYSYDAAGNRIKKMNPGSGPSNPGGGGFESALAAIDSVENDSLKQNLLKDNEPVDVVIIDKKNNVTADKTNTITPINTSNNIVDDEILLDSLKTSIDVLNSNELLFTISPNPVREQFTITENKQLKDLITSLTIYNSQGKIVQTFFNVNTPLVINVNSYEPGSYYAQVVMKSKTYILKFIKG